LTLYGTDIQFFSGDKLVNQPTFTDGAHNNDTFAGFGGYCHLRRCACYLKHVIGHIVGGSNNALPIIGIDVNGRHFFFMDEGKGLRNPGEGDVIPQRG